MAETIRELLEDFKARTGAEKVVLVSRTGMFIEGDDLDNQDTFSAMSAIVLGASETATAAIGTVEKIVVDLQKGHKLMITSAGKKGVLAVISKKDHWKELAKLKEQLKDLI